MRFMYNYLKIFFLKPYTVAAIISVVVIISLPDIFDKYVVEIIPTEKDDGKDKAISYSFDLDGDSCSEIIDSYDYNGKHSLQVITNDGGIVDQWNLKGNIPNSDNRVAFGDFDDDNYAEVYCLSDLNDTIFLFCIEPMDTIDPIWINNIPLVTLTREFNDPDYVIIKMDIVDMNNDGYSDLFLILNSGQARFPRNLYIYDIHNDTILVSDNYGITINGKAKIKDINQDGLPEIYGDIHSPGQVHDSLGYSYSDYDDWLMVYDNSLKLLFDPVKFTGFRSSIQTEHVNMIIPEYSKEPMDYLVVLYNHQGKLDNKPRLILFNLEGKIIVEYTFPLSKKIERWLNVEKDGNEYRFEIIDANGEITTFDGQLNKVKSSNLGLKQNSNCIKIDLDTDGLCEKIFIGSNGKIIITRDNYSYPVIITLDNNSYNFGIYTTKAEKTLLLVSSSTEQVFFDYYKNPLYSLRIIIYLGIFLSIYFFIVLIRKLQLIQIQKKEKIKNQIIELQLKSFKNQMDPHFTFNVFNTIAYKIQKESPESYEAFVEFSNLIRKTLLSSDSITRPIYDELSKLESYLKLEKLRFGNKINYQINIADDIDQSFQIPKMILQTYVENAIKHGIRHKVGSGNVTVELYTSKKYLSIEITDDGVGREKAKKMSIDSTGFGLKIMDNYFKMFNEYNVSKIRHSITDLYNDQQISIGTKVNIYIPLNFSYSFSNKQVIPHKKN